MKIHRRCRWIFIPHQRKLLSFHRAHGKTLDKVLLKGPDNYQDWQEGDDGSRRHGAPFQSAVGDKTGDHDRQGLRAVDAQDDGKQEFIPCADKRQNRGRKKR